MTIADYRWLIFVALSVGFSFGVVVGGEYMRRLLKRVPTATRGDFVSEVLGIWRAARGQPIVHDQVKAEIRIAEEWLQYRTFTAAELAEPPGRKTKI
jgi:hypothetical protein